MAELFIIDENWQEQLWAGTGGTRNKKLLLNLNDNKYYFKESLYKPAYANKIAKNYKYEFWSEIIASEVGILLGFNVLKYDIGIDYNIVGCICESMINADKEEFIEGVKYLQEYDSAFDSKTKEGKAKYTFQLIESAMNSVEYIDVDKFWKNMIEMIIFDAIIGNQDRHQENWAIIKPYTRTQEANNLDFQKAHFAPIYDSGSSLGRELPDEKLIEYTKEKIEHYISKGNYEIRWEREKIGYFEFIRELLLIKKYQNDVKICIERIVKLFNVNELDKVILNIDAKLSDGFKGYMIPMERKELIYKLITSRIKKLNKLL